MQASVILPSTGVSTAIDLDEPQKNIVLGWEIMELCVLFEELTLSFQSV